MAEGCDVLTHAVVGFVSVLVETEIFVLVSVFAGLIRSFRVLYLLVFVVSAMFCVLELGIRYGRGDRGRELMRPLFDS
jgi:hypothetical protein